MHIALIAVLLVALSGCASPVALDAMPKALTDAPGDAVRGRGITLGREANCILCHAFPDSTARFMGDIAPILTGVGARLSVAQLRLRIVDSSRLNPATPMPPYHRTTDLVRVAEAYRGKPVLNAQEVEDVVAYLATLK